MDNRKGCGLIVSIAGLLLAVLTFVFGDNIYERVTNRPLFRTTDSSQNGSPTSASLENTVVEINGEVWSTSISEPGIYQSNILSNENLVDFSIEVDITFNDTNPEFHGTLVRKQDDEKFYSFRVTPNGEFIFDIWEPCENCEGASHRPLLGPVSSRVLKTGKGVVNRLKIVATGSKFALFINGEHVGTVTDDTYKKGRVGLISCTCDGSSQSSVTYLNALLNKP